MSEIEYINVILILTEKVKELELEIGRLENEIEYLNNLLDQRI